LFSKDAEISNVRQSHQSQAEQYVDNTKRQRRGSFTAAESEHKNHPNEADSGTGITWESVRRDAEKEAAEEKQTAARKSSPSGAVGIAIGSSTVSTSASTNAQTSGVYSSSGNASIAFRPSAPSQSKPPVQEVKSTAAANTSSNSLYSSLLMETTGEIESKQSGSSKHSESAGVDVKKNSIPPIPQKNSIPQPTSANQSGVFHSSLKTKPIGNFSTTPTIKPQAMFFGSHNHNPPPNASSNVNSNTNSLGASVAAAPTVSNILNTSLNTSSILNTSALLNASGLDGNPLVTDRSTCGGRKDTVSTVKSSCFGDSVNGEKHAEKGNAEKGNVDKGNTTSTTTTGYVQSRPIPTPSGSTTNVIQLANPSVGSSSFGLSTGFRQASIPVGIANKHAKNSNTTEILRSRTADLSGVKNSGNKNATIRANKPMATPGLIGGRQSPMMGIGMATKPSLQVPGWSQRPVALGGSVAASPAGSQ